MTEAPNHAADGVVEPDADDAGFSIAAVRAAYDTVAADYAVAFADDLQRLPLDRAMLDAVGDRLPPRSLALDLGCGPAPVGAYLQGKGMRVIGADLAAGMLAVARIRSPSLALVQADTRHLPFRDGSLTAVAAYYSIQHLPRRDLDGALGELNRVLEPGGFLLLATHLGDGDVYIDEFLGHRIAPVGGALFGRDELRRSLVAGGFDIDMEQHRGPLPHEVDTQRIYLLAHSRPAT